VGRSASLAAASDFDLDIIFTLLHYASTIGQRQGAYVKLVGELIAVYYTLESNDKCA
jgi:hypothetical protein